MDATKRNRLGSGSLLAAITGFLIVELQPWLPISSVALFGGLTLKGLLEAFFEASMVGGFADWFAVTALFKDPLGIPMPHTNILAKNKDAIADAVPRFLTGFVSPVAIAEELGKIDFASKAAEALSEGGSRGALGSFLRTRAVEFIGSGLGSGEAKAAALRRFVDEVMGFLSDRVDAPAEAAALLSWARKKRLDEKALEAIAEYARNEIGRNRGRLISILTPLVKRNAGWQGLFIGTGTVERFLAGMQEELVDIRVDKANDFRRFIISSISAYASELEAQAAGEEGNGGGSARSGNAGQRLSTAFRDVLADEGFRDGFALFAGRFLSRLAEDISGPENRFAASLERLEAALIARLTGDEELRGRLNSLAASLIAGVIERGKVIEGVTEYLAGLLRSTDERFFVDRIEDAVWNDLQYIRVNGAVVGGLVGLAITTVKAALGG